MLQIITNDEVNFKLVQLLNVSSYLQILLNRAPIKELLTNYCLEEILLTLMMLLKCKIYITL